MITLRRDTERQRVRRASRETLLSLDPQGRPGPLAGGFEGLAAFDELRLSPGGSATLHRREETEILTYVYRGALSQEDKAGNSIVLHMGEFQRLTTGPGDRHKETNASLAGETRVFRVSLLAPGDGHDGAREQKRFTAAQRRNRLCVTASPDGRTGSLRLSRDAALFSSILDPGHHMVHALHAGRSVWLHVVDGEVRMNDLVLSRGDGVGVAAEPAVSLTGLEGAEILMIDLGPAPGASRKRRPGAKEHAGGS
jgi:redox-sensitive bicupin YhaK (pirin superfamily)